MLFRKKIKVFIVDDQNIAVNILRSIIEKQQDMEVIDTASDGMEALQKLSYIKPDIITLDIEMPRLDGISTLKHIMDTNPIPVIMVSSLTEANADITFKALEIGALDYVTKPNKGFSENIEIIEETLLEKIRKLIGYNFKKKFKKNYEVIHKRTIWPKIEAIAISASTGGPGIVSHILSEMQPLGIPVFIVQHMPEKFTRVFARRLNDISKLYIKEAEDGEEINADTVYIARGNHHLKFKKKDNKIILDQGPLVNGHRPSCDIMFSEVASKYGKNSIGIILSGMGKDGAIGLLNMHKKGSITLAQDAGSCVIFGMPKVALQIGAVDRVVSPDLMVPLINDFVELGKKYNLG